MNSNFLSAMLGAVAVAIVFGALALGGVFDGDDGKDAPSAAAAVPRPSETADSDADAAEVSETKGVIATDVSNLYEDVRSGVVSVETTTGGGGGTGSGFVLDDQGYILTNDHVVEDSDSVQVRFSEGGPVKAKVVGADPSSDLAMLKVDPDDAKLQPLALGSSKQLRVGVPAVALGSPFGLDGTLTTGVVSALDRSIQAPNDFSIDGVVQTDAAINPGNSGGPLLDQRGRVIGINAQIATSTRSNSGVGFAIPIDTAKSVLEDLKAGKEIRRPYLGVSSGTPRSGTGAVIGRVVDDGPADKAGVKVGDRVLKIDDKKVVDADDVSGAITSYKPGQKVRIQVRRSGDTRSVTVTLGTRPSQAPRG